MSARLVVAAVAVLVAILAPAEASFINYSSREINVKVVYVASNRASWAATENLKYIYGKTAPEAKGKMIKLATKTESTLFFDFLPLHLGEIRGFKTRFHLYTTPGATEYSGSRRLILKGVDGIIFVADADPKSAKANVAALAELKEQLAELGYDLEKIPLAFQLQGTRKTGAVSVDELKTALGIGDHPYFEADVATGIGVFDTLKSVAKQILMELKKSGDDAAAKQPPANQPPANEPAAKQPPAKATPRQPPTKNKQGTVTR
jgi:signal recognition particle receptor subunit beta